MEHTLNDFEQLFLTSRKFILGDNISFADLSAICEIDQPSEYRTNYALQADSELINQSINLLLIEYIGYSTFKNRNKLARWYDLVQEELGDYYTEVNGEFKAKLKQANDQQHQQGEVQAHAVKQ